MIKCVRKTLKIKPPAIYTLFSHPLLDCVKYRFRVTVQLTLETQHLVGFNCIL